MEHNKNRQVEKNPFINLTKTKNTMKKIFAIAAMAAMLMACGGNDEDPQNKPGTNPGDDDPIEEVTPDITIDGNFDDWNIEGVAEVVLGTEGTYADVDLKKIKLYADALSINIYAEFDPTVAMVLGCHMDIDGDETTGRSVPWKGIELYFEGAIYNWRAEGEGDNAVNVEQLEGVAWNPGVFEFTGDDGTDVWSWGSLLEGGLANGSVPASIGNGLAAIEVQIMREMIPVALGDAVGVGIMLTNNMWDQCGVLPQVSMEQEEAGEASAVLSVTLP